MEAALHPGLGARDEVGGYLLGVQVQVAAVVVAVVVRVRGAESRCAGADRAVDVEVAGQPLDGDALGGELGDERARLLGVVCVLAPVGQHVGHQRVGGQIGE